MLSISVMLLAVCVVLTCEARMYLACYSCSMGSCPRITNSVCFLVCEPPIFVLLLSCSLSYGLFHPRLHSLGEDRVYSLARVLKQCHVLHLYIYCFCRGIQVYSWCSSSELLFVNDPRVGRSYPTVACVCSCTATVLSESSGFAVALLYCSFLRSRQYIVRRVEGGMKYCVHGVPP